jgi:uncharacterized protein YndB with AHSA1/START domain
MSITISKSVIVAASPLEVYRAFTNERVLAEWWCEVAHVNPHEGGNIYLAWEDGYATAGVFEETFEGKSIRFKWRSQTDTAASSVQIHLTASGKATKVDIEHSGFQSDQDAQKLSRPWDAALENLAEYFTSGEDLRISRRPMLGVRLGNIVDAKMVAELNLPVAHGIEMEGTVEGMSAARAGLTQDDVVTRLNGVDLTDYGKFGPALEDKQAGDVVEVQYIREGKIHTVQMELSARTLTPVPDSPAGLTDSAAQVYAKGQAELAQILQGVSEAQADVLPAEGEWSLRQILGHLICNERDNHTRISLAVGGSPEPWSFYNNSLLRIRPILEAYPNLAGLVEELKRCEAQTVACLRGLPEEFVEQRGSYVAMGRGILFDASDHISTHVEQMQGAIKSAG